MGDEARITTLLLDIGGVLLTNSWDQAARQRAAERFGLDAADLEERHLTAFDAYEEGAITLEEYLRWVVFSQPRDFSAAEFKVFLYGQSQPQAEMMELIRRLKADYGLKTVAVNNEGRELNEYRIKQFRLQELIDLFISSCFVHRRKPSEGMYTLALNIAQARLEQTVYIEAEPLMVEVAQRLGIRCIPHRSVAATKTALAELGLRL